MKLAFVELGVRSLGVSLGWYQRALGLAAAHLDIPHGFALLHDGHGGQLALKVGVPGSVRLQFEVADLNDEVVRLATLGIAPDGEIRTRDEGYRSATFRDPDGYAVALFEYVRCA